MTITELEKRLLKLEKAVEELKAQIKRPDDPLRPWGREDVGRFANDPIFEEIVRLGREYRESLRPGRRKRVKHGRT